MLRDRCRTVKLAVLVAARFFARLIDYRRPGVLLSRSPRDSGSARSWRSEILRAYDFINVFICRPRPTSAVLTFCNFNTYFSINSAFVTRLIQVFPFAVIIFRSVHCRMVLSATSSEPSSITRGRRPKPAPLAVFAAEFSSVENPPKKVRLACLFCARQSLV